MPKLTKEIRITHPLAGMVVTVRITPGARIRVWCSLQLIKLALRISGGTLVVKDESPDV